MDIGNIIAADKLAEFEVKHPITKKPTGIFIGVYGQHSKIFRDKMNGNIQARQAKNVLAAKDGEMPAPRAVDETEAENHELLATCIGSWRSVIEKNGKPTTESEPLLEYCGNKLPLTFENALKVLTDPNMRWLVQQVDDNVTKLENFTNG